MSFLIKFLNEPIPKGWLRRGEKGLLIEVRINDFSERGVVLTGFWDEKQYIDQWKDAIRELTGDQEISKAAFITIVHNPKNPQHGYVVQWWPAYRDGAYVYIRNGSIPYSKEDDVIDLKSPYKYVPERVKDEMSEGEPISEWQVPLRDIILFGKRLNDFYP